MFVLCSEHAEQASSRGVLEGGGQQAWRGEQQASCLVAKQAVEFPQVYTSYYYYCFLLFETT